jgi:hypothetical protein
MECDQSLVNAACLSEVLITSRMPEKATMSYDGVLHTIDNYTIDR